MGSFVNFVEQNKQIVVKGQMLYCPLTAYDSFASRMMAAKEKPATELALHRKICIVRTSSELGG